MPLIQPRQARASRDKGKKEPEEAAFISAPLGRRMGRACLRLIVGESSGRARKEAREKLLLAMGAKARKGKCLSVPEQQEKVRREREEQRRKKADEGRFEAGAKANRKSKKSKKKLVKRKGGEKSQAEAKGLKKAKKNSVK